MTALAPVRERSEAWAAAHAYVTRFDADMIMTAFDLSSQDRSDRAADLAARTLGTLSALFRLISGAVFGGWGRFAVQAWVLGLLLTAASAPALARAPEPGDRVRITLHDGNTLVGELLSLSETGYRLRFGGMELIVAYPSVRGIEVVVGESLLEEMRPHHRRGGTGHHPWADPEIPSEDSHQELPSNEDFGRASPNFAPPPPSPYAPAPGPSAGPPADPRPNADSPSAFSPPPPRRPPSRGDDNRDQQSATEIPPKPRSQGTGLMISGFVLLGVGAGVTGLGVLGTEAANDPYLGDSESAEGYEVLTVAGGIMAGSGLVLAVTGIILKSVSGARRRAWQRRYGQLEGPPVRDVVLTPTLGPGGSGGLSLVGRF